MSALNEKLHEVTGNEAVSHVNLSFFPRLNTRNERQRERGGGRGGVEKECKRRGEEGEK